MRTKIPFFVLKYNTNGDGSITYLTNNGKWLENSASTIGYASNQFKFWMNSGNAWNCIAKLVKAKKENFEDLFVWSQNELTPFTENDSISFSLIQSLTTDQGELDAIAKEALDQKTKQIQLLEETLTELRVGSNAEDA